VDLVPPWNKPATNAIEARHCVAVFASCS